MLIDRLSTLRRFAEAGNPEAQYRLGEMYAGGDGVAQNTSEAVHWLRQAALAGVEDAREILEWLAPEILLEENLWRDESSLKATTTRCGGLPFIRLGRLNNWSMVGDL